jgi:GTP pyrophosphokinase
LIFLQDFKTSFLAEEIYVYTPKGDIKMLPIGASALDFAFWGTHLLLAASVLGQK